MNEVNKRRVIERLEAYQAQIRDLLQLIGKAPLSQQDKAQAQAQLKTLKESLKEDYQSGATVRGQAALNDVEKAFFQPAIHQAHATINVKWNSNPSSDWSSKIYSAKIDIEHALHGLRDM